MIGESDRGVLVVVFTVRQPGDVVRLISARPARRKERRQYEESKRLSN
ncbi:MAG: BrnT family toxin [Deltaproteobacteria bacterium]|nr:BrnT family toxin [Deltaproteobacteria bacterium]MBI3388206.1 BrnT family toxin [Deltaproteobacteria bacterium]